MKTDTFDKLLTLRLSKIEDTLGTKAAEYASNGDRLHNFKVAARVDNEPVPVALWGMAKKHLVSVMDIVQGRTEATPAMVDEKVGDLINYLVLLEAVFYEISPDVNTEGTTTTTPGTLTAEHAAAPSVPPRGAQYHG